MYKVGKTLIRPNPNFNPDTLHSTSQTRRQTQQRLKVLDFLNRKESL